MWLLTHSFLLQSGSEVRAVTSSSGKKVNIALCRNSAQGGNKIKLLSIILTLGFYNWRLIYDFGFQEYATPTVESFLYKLPSHCFLKLHLSRSCHHFKHFSHLFF
jgi:hypothetical protein